jgi:hypothetical protein
LEKSWVISFYGIIKTSYFQARRQGGHRLLWVVAIRHLQLHPSTRARVHQISTAAPAASAHS